MPMHPNPNDDEAFEAFAQDQDPLDIAAATWVTRKRNGQNTEGDAELQAWLDADPRHAEAFEDMDATWGELQQLPQHNVARLKTLTTSHSATQVAPLKRVSGWKSAWMDLQRLVHPLMPPTATALMALTLVGGGWSGWHHWQQQPVFEQTYATPRGQQLKATLPDAVNLADTPGSALQLDTATKAQVSLYRDRREVHLHSGQALFAVRNDPKRPFHVYAGAVRITVVGTRFSVRHTATGLDAGHTVVAVEEGRVRVEKKLETSTENALPPTLELTAGQTVVANAQGHMGTVTTFTSLAPWRNGRLSFDQTPLAQAVAEFERYGDTGLVVSDPTVAAMPVGGSYTVRQWQRFAETLPEVLPVRLVRQGKVTVVRAQ